MASFFTGLSRSEFICILHYGLRLLRVQQKPFVLRRFTAFTVTRNSFPITGKNTLLYKSGIEWKDSLFVVALDLS